MSTWKSRTAGILSIVAGSAGIAVGAMVGGFAVLLQGLTGTELSKLLDRWAGTGGTDIWGPGIEMMPEVLDMLPGLASTLLIAVTIAVIVFGVIALVGGINAVKRRRWGLALAGAILAIPVMPPLGVLAVIFVSIGKREF
mgnify:CR=1 FL=1